MSQISFWVWTGSGNKMWLDAVADFLAGIDVLSRIDRSFVVPPPPVLHVGTVPWAPSISPTDFFERANVQEEWPYLKSLNVNSIEGVIEGIGRGVISIFRNLFPNLEVSRKVYGAGPIPQPDLDGIVSNALKELPSRNLDYLPARIALAKDAVSRIHRTLYRLNAELKWEARESDT